MTDHGSGNGRVAGKVAVVTGAASGIGAATARLLAAEGARVVLADLDLDRAGDVRDEIEAAGGTAIVLRLDVTDESAWEATMASALETYGRLDIAVNCAGTRIQRSVPTETTLADWRFLMAVNLDGVFLGTKHALLAMQAVDPVVGSIINISSIMGNVGMAGIGAYNASKGGVRTYSKSVALSCADEGLNIRVNTVHPGFVDTPLLRQAMDAMPDREEAQRLYDELQPMGRLGRPEDIAFGVLYLASDESSFVTGAELVIDGGYTAR
jgi:NAD(P)-dependent dehydrogenase (short-subunit alcohol dehydrogenase family)